MSNKLKSRLLTIGLSESHASQLSLYHKKQLTSRGVPGTIQLFKLIGDGILSYLYGTPEFPQWLSKTRSGFPKAVSYLKDYPEETLVRLSKIARNLKFSSIQQSQIDKVVVGATSPFCGGNYFSAVSEIIELGIRSARFVPNHNPPIHPPLIGRQFRRIQSVSGPVPTCMEPPFVESLELLSATPALNTLEYVWETFIPLHVTQPSSDGINEYAGEIHATQEGGGKLRMYASPYTVFQCLLSPIHDWIDSFRKRLETDCTYDQLKGAKWAHSLLQQDETVYSVDLSTATCRFPLDIQLWLLARLGLADRFVEAFRWVSRAKWKVNPSLVKEGFPTEISWTVGQPLGIRPSMSAFSLTHNLLLAGCCKKLGLSPVESFRVLGDDVVLRHRSLYELYTSLIDLMGIPISYNKSHISNKYAEFAGFGISKSIMVRPGQWREATADNHLDLSMEFGTPLEHETGREWLGAQKLWLFMHGKYSPTQAQEWNSLLKASSLLQTDLLDNWQTNRYQVSWFYGVMSVLNKQFPNGFRTRFVPALMPKPESIFKPLPESKWKRYWVDVYEQQVDMCDYDISNYTGAYTCAYMALHNLWNQGSIDNTQLARISKEIDANYASLFWLPPPEKFLRSKSLTKKLVKVLATI